MLASAIISGTKACPKGFCATPLNDSTAIRQNSTKVMSHRYNRFCWLYSSFPFAKVVKAEHKIKLVYFYCWPTSPPPVTGFHPAIHLAFPYGRCCSTTSRRPPALGHFGGLREVYGRSPNTSSRTYNPLYKRITGAWREEGRSCYKKVNILNEAPTSDTQVFALPWGKYFFLVRKKVFSN